MDRRKLSKFVIELLLSAVLLPAILSTMPVHPWVVAVITAAAIVAVFLWGHTPSLGWRRRVGPVLMMVLGVFLLVGGAVWFQQQGSHRAESGTVATPSPSPAPPTAHIAGEGTDVDNAVAQTLRSNMQAQAPVRRAEPAGTELGLRADSTPGNVGQSFWPIVGCAFPQGVPTGPTALTDSSIDDLRERIRRYSKSLRAHETAFKANERQALSLQPKAGEDAVELRQAALDSAKHDAILGYQAQLKPEADVLVRELHVRLRRPYPTNTAEGVSVGGFGAACNGLFYGDTPLSDLADWLTRLGGELH